jgi:VIT1/CCC1 family predicted Fe2+/Mn2+ transporter
VSGLQSWHEEKQSAWLYRQLADCEPDPRIADLFRTLATAAERQAETWQPPGGSASFAPSARARLAARLARALGPRRVRPMLAALKVRGLSVYDSRPPPGHAMPTSVTQAERRHRGYGGGNLRAAVFGVNDGLVSNASLIMGVAGASAGADAVVTAGVAGLLAGALSMAAGEYVSMRSQREMFEYQIGLERDELAEYPEEEAEELALIYAARGMDLEEARRITRTLVKNPEAALDALAREELGLNPDELGSPWVAALSSFTAFTAGAALPLLPFLFNHDKALTASITLTALGLFAVGASMSLFTGRHAVLSGLRMLGIGGAAGLATWFIGAWLGVSLA